MAFGAESLGVAGFFPLLFLKKLEVVWMGILSNLCIEVVEITLKDNPYPQVYFHVVIGRSNFFVVEKLHSNNEGLFTNFSFSFHGSFTHLQIKSNHKLKLHNKNTNT